MTMEELGQERGVRAPYEGEVTRRVERMTSTVPSMAFLAAAGLSVAGAIVLFGMGRKLPAIFVGLWPPTFLLLGTYNKVVKLARAQQKRSSILS